MAHSDSSFPTINGNVTITDLRFGVAGEDALAAENRIFDAAGHFFNIGNASTILLQSDSVTLGSGTEGGMIQASWNTQQPRIDIGDVGNWGNNTVLTVDDALKQLIFSAEDGVPVVTLLDLNLSTKIYRFGTINDDGFEINDNSSLFRLWSGTGLWFLVSGTGGSGIVRLGDMNNTANSTVAQLTDNVGTFDLSSATPPAYSIQGVPGVYGSFVAQSGETITVEGGIITAITAP